MHIEFLTAAIFPEVAKTSQKSVRNAGEAAEFACGETAGVTQHIALGMLAGRRGAEEVIGREIGCGGNRKMVLSDLPSQHHICRPHASSCESQQQGKWKLRMDWILHRNPMLNQIGNVLRQRFCSTHIAPWTAVGAVPSQLRFHCKGESQEAQANGKYRASELPMNGWNS
jgi:hypothetical protein